MATSRCPVCRHKAEVTRSGECCAKLHPVTKRALSKISARTLWVYCGCGDSAHKATDSKQVSPVNTLPVWCCDIGTVKRIVAAKTKRAAALALGMTLYSFNQYCSETKNAHDVALANQRPGEVYTQDHKKPGYWKDPDGTLIYPLYKVNPKAARSKRPAGPVNTAPGTL